MLKMRNILKVSKEQGLSITNARKLAITLNEQKGYWEIEKRYMLEETEQHVTTNKHIVAQKSLREA